jgi:lysophospholipase L1-like esterase
VAALPPPDSPLETPCIDPAGAAATQPCRLRAMDRFFAKLTRTAARSATRPLRISQFGDSLVMGDDFTGELRRLLQAQFGDGGHGFFYIGNPDRPYGAAEVGFGVSEEWTVRTVVAGGSSNPLYGLAGAAFVTNGSPTFNASLRDGDRPVDRVGVLYHARDTRGGFDVTGDGQRFARDLTVARGSSGIEWVDLGVEARRVRVSRFRGDWIFFGAVLEHSGPGVVVDNLGMVSGRIHQLMKIGERHWQQQIGARGTDLASFFFGVNDAAEGNGFAARSADYRAKYDGVLRRARGALPDGDCLVISILTRGDRRDGRIVTYASVGQIAAVQQQSALAQGCGFWNAYAAIGGDEGARRWYDASPRLLGGDLSHPTRTGYVRLGAMLYGTLASAYLAWIDRQIAGRP